MNDIKKDRRYQNIRIGDRVDFTRCFSMESFQEFSRLSRDSNPLHHDMTYVMATSFQQPIQPLHLTSIPLSAIAGMMLPGHRSYYLGCQMRALYPASYHVDITYSSKVVAKNDHLQTITLRTIAFQGVRIILDAEQIIQVRDDIASEMAPHHDMDITIKSVSLDRTALITGASGAIGSAMALRLASHGFNLILTSRSRDAEFEGHVLQRCQEYGVEVEWITVDLESEANELSPLVSRLGAGSVVTDLVHVASPRVHATANELLNVNYTAMKTLTEAFLPQVLRRQEGRVLFTGSSAVQQAPLGWEDYSAAKAAASQYITAMNNHYGQYGFTGWILAPGLVATRFSEGLRGMNTQCLQPEEVAESAYALLNGRHGNSGGYFLLESGAPPRLGRFGFYFSETSTVPKALPLADDTGKSSSAPAINASEGDFDRLFRQFFRLGSAVDISQARVGESPYWDSLRHIEFILFLESKWGLSFNSGEMDGTKRYLDLKKLLASKIGNV